MLVLGVGLRLGGHCPVVGAGGRLACWSWRCLLSSGPVGLCAAGDVVGGGSAGVAMVSLVMTLVRVPHVGFGFW